MARFTDPANADTWATGLRRIQHAQISYNEAPAATDAVAVTFSGGTVTFAIVGVARDVSVLVVGEGGS